MAGLKTDLADAIGDSLPTIKRFKGDSVGVVVSWKWRDSLDGVTGEDFDRAASAIRAGRWKVIQAKEWVGRPIAKALGLDLASKSGKAKVKALIQVWLKAGSLAVVEEKDEHRETKKS